MHKGAKMCNVVKFYTYNMQSLSWFDLDNSDISAYKSLLNTYNATNVMIVDVVDMGQGIYKISFKDKLLGIESEFETALKIAEKYVKNKEKDEKTFQKCYKYLLSKGFSYDDSLNATKKVLGDNDD